MSTTGLSIVKTQRSALECDIEMEIHRAMNPDSPASSLPTCMEPHYAVYLRSASTRVSISRREEWNRGKGAEAPVESECRPQYRSTIDYQKGSTAAGNGSAESLVENRGDWVCLPGGMYRPVGSWHVDHRHRSPLD